MTAQCCKKLKFSDVIDMLALTIGLKDVHFWLRLCLSLMPHWCFLFIGHHTAYSLAGPDVGSPVLASVTQHLQKSKSPRHASIFSIWKMLWLIEWPVILFVLNPISRKLQKRGEVQSFEFIKCSFKLNSAIIFWVSTYFLLCFTERG